MVTQPDWRAWRVDSAGTWAIPGQPAALEAQQVIAQRGLDLSTHRSRMVSYELLRRFQLVLTMEAGQKEAILVEFPDFKDRVFMLSEMAGEIEAVQDPVGGTVIDFERSAGKIDAWITKGLERILLLALPVQKTD
jgi:protein-tyrosine phosphatase